MGFNIEDKLVIGIASSALFRLDEAAAVFEEQGLAAYRAYQREHEDDCLAPGAAFPFVKRLLRLNSVLDGEPQVEVVLMSRNDPDTGLRVFNSIQRHGLDITRAVFLTGASPFHYIPAFNVSLFLTANENDARESMRHGLPAGIVLDSAILDDPDDYGLRIAFDFDGVIADDSAEQVFQKKGLDAFTASEAANSDNPHSPGPLGRLLNHLGRLRCLDSKRIENEPDAQRFLELALVTARNAPAHRRVVTTLREWHIEMDRAFFLGGTDKTRIIQELRPHIFFDDQPKHLTLSRAFSPSVHIPYGMLNAEQSS